MEDNQNPLPTEFDQPQFAQAKPMMPFWTAVKTCFKKYFDFKGRARRSEYWWFILFIFIISIVWSLIYMYFLMTIEPFNDTLAFSTYLKTTGLMILPMLFLVIPQWAVLTRRLHDSGHSGWWVVASLAVSFIYMIVYYSMMYQVYKNIENMEYTPVSLPLTIISVILALAVLVIGIILLVFTIQDSKREENKYGPSPKYQ